MSVIGSKSLGSNPQVANSADRVDPRASGANQRRGVLLLDGLSVGNAAVDVPLEQRKSAAHGLGTGTNPG